MRKPVMLALAGAAIWMATGSPAAARYEGPWCMHMTIGRDTVISRCDMRSYEACRAEMFGIGGSYCTQNPYYWWNAKAEPPRRKAKRRAHRHR